MFLFHVEFDICSIINVFSIRFSTTFVCKEIYSCHLAKSELLKIINQIYFLNVITS